MKRLNSSSHWNGLPNQGFPVGARILLIQANLAYLSDGVAKEVAEEP